MVTQVSCFKLAEKANCEIRNFPRIHCAFIQNSFPTAMRPSQLASFIAILLILTTEIVCGGPELTASPKLGVGILDNCIERMQFKTSEVLFQQIRETISLRSFPVDLFPMGLSRQSRNTEQAALILSARCTALLDRWNKDSIKKSLTEDFEQNRLMFAAHQVKELKDEVKDILDQRAVVVEQTSALRNMIQKDYRPRGYSEFLLHTYGFFIHIAVYVVAVILPLAFLLPTRGKWSVFRLSLAMSVACGAALSGHALVQYVQSNLGAPEPVVQVRHYLDTLGPYIEEFVHCSNDANGTLRYLNDYCEVMDVYNKTILGGIIEFANNVTAIAARETTSPEVALQLVVQTKERIKAQKTSLAKLSAARTKGSRKTELDKLLEFLDYFEIFFAQMELSVYSNLKAGYDMNHFFMEHLDIISTHIQNGDLISCVSILSELYRQQTTQLSNLQKANKYVHDTNDAITQIRIESTRLQPELESEEMDFWIKKMASKGSMAAISIPVLAAFSIPALAAAPIGAAGAAVALIGYNWKDAYEKAEKDTRSVIQEIIRLDDILRQTEDGLSNHEKVLTMLMEDVGAVLRAVNQSQSRFGHIQLRRAFSSREMAFLTSGVERTKDAVKTLNSRYESAMATLFKRILAMSSTTPPPPKLLELPENSQRDEGSSEQGDEKLDHANEPLNQNRPNGRRLEASELVDTIDDSRE